MFQPLFDAVIKMYHKVDKVEHPTPTFGDLDNLGFGDLDPEGNMIVSTRVRVGRTHDGFSFPPCSNKEVHCRSMSRILVGGMSITSERMQHSLHQNVPNFRKNATYST